MDLVYKKNELIYIVTSLLFFFQIYLQKEITIFRYFDEVVTMLCLCKIITSVIKNRINKEYRHILVLIILLGVVGIVGNYINHIQTGIIPILIDYLNCSKVFIVFIGASLFLKESSNKKKIVKNISLFIELFVFIAFIYMILHELHIVSMGSDVRYGIRSFTFINNGAGQLSMMFYSTLFILTLEKKYYPTNKRVDFAIIIALCVWVSTLRSRAFMYVLIYIFLYIKAVIKKEKFKISFSTIVIIFAILVFFGMDQYETYFNNTKTARSNFLIHGFHIMINYFPIGTGFGTFGTDVAFKYYSSLYYELGFNYVHGLSPVNGIFSHDTYWPAIFAQFGVIGTILISVILFKVFKLILNKTKANRINFFMALFICVTQVTSSMATATFFHFMTVGLFFMLPLVFDKKSDWI